MADVQQGASGALFNRVPFMGLLGMQRTLSEAGRAQLVVDGRSELTNLIGSVHGGVVLTLLDVVMASAAVSQVNFERTAVTLGMTSQFLRPGHGPLTADGQVCEVDGDVVHCRAEVHDAQGRTVALAQGCFRYLPLSAAAPHPIGDKT
ncbi:MAG: PaaI family thioesterase [Burkholderiaceae bacterium]|nr:PaaI family thioesterase [Burkholderiaceae bacterium]